MTFPAKPRDLERFAVVVMVLLGRRVLAHGTGLRKKFSPALVHVGISTGHGPLALIVRKVRVTWAVVPGVRSMARAAVALGQSIIRTEALGASCFHGTNCSTNTKKLQGKSVYRRRGPFLTRAKKCFTQHIPCKTGLKPAQPATRPVFWGPWVVGTHLGARARGPWARAPGRRPSATRASGSRITGQGSRTRHRATRTRRPGSRPPGRADRGHQAPGARPPGPEIMPAPGSAPDYRIIAK